MKTMLKAWCACTLLALAAPAARGQFTEDVLRYSWQGPGPGGRSLAMGSSGMSFLDDYSAAYWNPAGIAQSKLNQFSFGISHLSHRNSAVYMGTRTPFSSNQTSLDHLGLVYAVPTTRGSLSVGIGYDRASEYTTGLSFSGFNPSSSIIQFWAPDGRPYPDNLTRAEVLELARVDTVNGTFVSPIADSVRQGGTTLEGGGLNRFSITGAAEAARNLYVGVGINFLSGSYAFSSRFDEADALGLYESFPFDYASLEVLDIVEADLSGFNVNAGLLYRFSPNARFAVAMRTPSWITVQERFTSDAVSRFDDGSTRSDPAGGDPGSFTEYDITTPFVFSTGLSGGTADVTVAGAVEYTDYTQMEFRNATNALLALNTDIREIYRATVNVRLGGEVRIPDSDFFVRGGFILLPSPFEGDPSSFDRKYYTGGVGFRVENSVGVDLAYARGTWESFRWVYGDASSGTLTFTDLEEITTHSFRGTVSVRF